MIDYNNMKVLLESILLEDKLSDLQSRYSHIHPDTIKDIWNNGVPSNNQGKYIDWSIKENIKSHNPSRTKNALEIYDRNKDKIGKFNHQWSINDLESITHPFTDEGKSFNKKAEEGTSTHYEDNDIIVKQHNNHPSAVKAGFLHVDNSCYNNTNEPGKAEWCVSANSEEGNSHFNNYTENGKYPLYTIENKKDKTKTAVVLNPNKNPELRDEHDNALKPYQIIYNHPNVINSELGNKLLNMGNTKEILDKVPANASENQLLKGLGDTHWGVRHAVVSHSKASEQVLLKGLNDNDSDVRHAAISHPKATEQMLLKGLNDNNSGIRKAAISHPKATEQVLLKGLNDNDSDVRHAVISHPKATEQVLLKGLNDNDSDVRHAVISHPKATEQMLLKGLNDNDSDVRHAVISHPKATEQMLLKGLNDNNSNVRHAAVSHSNATEQMLLKGLNDNYLGVRRAAVSHSNATEQTLLKGLNDNDWVVRHAAVSHSKASEQMLLKGLEDNDWVVRSAAVSHPKATEQVLLKGVEDNTPEVRSLARKRLVDMKKDS